MTHLPYRYNLHIQLDIVYITIGTYMKHKNLHNRVIEFKITSKNGAIYLYSFSIPVSVQIIININIIYGKDFEIPSTSLQPMLFTRH